MRMRVAALLLALGLLPPLPVGAVGFAGLTQLLRRETSTLATLESLNEWIAQSEQEIAESRYRHRQLDSRLAEAERRAQALDHRSVLRRRHVRQRVRSLYKLSRGGVVRLLVEAMDQQDLAVRLSAASLVLRRDARELTTFREELARLGAERATLERQRGEQLALRQRLEARRGELSRARGEQLALLRQVQRSRRLQLALGAEMDKQQRALFKRVGELAERAHRAGGFYARRGRLPRPVAGPVVTIYGTAVDPERKISVLRQGLTFRPAPRAPVLAVAEGTVRVAGPFVGYGTLALVEHEGGYFTLYGFLAALAVSEGQTVRRGQLLGKAGTDPLTGERALYFELRHRERPLDPAPWLRR